MNFLIQSSIYECKALKIRWKSQLKGCRFTCPCINPALKMVEAQIKFHDWTNVKCRAARGKENCSSCRIKLSLSDAEHRLNETISIVEAISDFRALDKS